LVISLTLALLNHIPNDLPILIELKRLEAVGEAIIEHLFLLELITNDQNWGFSYPDIENRRI